MVALNSLLEFWAPAIATPIDRLATTASARIVLVSRLDMPLPSDRETVSLQLLMTRAPDDPSRLCLPRLPLFTFQMGTTALLPRPLHPLALGHLERAADHRAGLARVDHVVDHPVL